MTHVLPPLPYATDALEPHVDALTMEIHHGRHHAAYVSNLNAALEKTPALADRDLGDLLAHLDDVPAATRAAVRNHGGGHWNHAFFWPLLTPKGGEPRAELARAIDTRFGSFDTFWQQFTAAAMGRFGSGWAWLSLDGHRDLVIHSTPNQDAPMAEGLVPVLGIDVWEHAYYLKHQNRRADWVAAFRNVVDWDRVQENWQAAKRRR
jgi:Fe-Mn family superoxide dismutase